MIIKMLSRSFFALAILIGCANAWATPARVILLRHAEKSLTNDADPNLSERGQERAQALVNFFATNSHILEKAEPSFFFAMNAPHNGGSIRAIQTIQPLADARGIKINTNYTHGQTDALVKLVLTGKEFDGKVVLICWNHDDLPAIADALGLGSRAPAVWSGQTFDRVWILDYANDAVSSFENIPQHLLPGDSDQ